MADITARKDSSAQPLSSRLQDLLRELEARWNANAPETFEVKETKDASLFKADVPDLEVTLTGQRNEEKEDKSDTSSSCERGYGSFSRSYTLPDGVDVDHLRAELKAGVLTVAVQSAPGKA